MKERPWKNKGNNKVLEGWTEERKDKGVVHEMGETGGKVNENEGETKKEKYLMVKKRKL